MRTLAVALCIPCIFYGVLGFGSALIVWALIDFDPLRIDVYAAFLAAAGPVAFLVHEERRRRGNAHGSTSLPIVLNLACSATALALAVTRSEMLRDPFLALVVLLLFVAPLLNVAVLRSE